MIWVFGAFEWKGALFRFIFKALAKDLSILSLFVAEEEFAVSFEKKKCVWVCIWARTNTYNLPFELISHELRTEPEIHREEEFQLLWLHTEEPLQDTPFLNIWALWPLLENDGTSKGGVFLASFPRDGNFIIIKY